jgi:hypothetical protein
MNAAEVFVMGLAIVIGSAFLAVSYLKAHLIRLLTALYGTEERARFWQASLRYQDDEKPVRHVKEPRRRGIS